MERLVTEFRSEREYPNNGRPERVAAERDGWLFRWRLANLLAGLFLPHDDPPRTLDACRNGLGLAATRAKGET